MSKAVTPTVETTKDFVLIKIPRRLFGGPVSHRKISALERGLGKSLEELKQGKAIGPFSNAKDLMRSLHRPR